MRLDDPALPAARYLAGPDALDVLRVPVEATGGRLETAKVVHVRYRPGSDVVVRYSASVSWNGAAPTSETLVATSTVHGLHPGIARLTAATRDGPLEVGVWRYPFDPVLVGLGDAVTRSGAAALLGLTSARTRVKVIAYRPADRAVVRVTHDDDPVAYLKIVAPDRVEPIAERHRNLRAGGVPAPDIVLADTERGLLALEPLVGPTWRDLMKETDDSVPWPGADAVAALCTSLAACDLPPPGPPSRITDGHLHARMLATVLPDLTPLLQPLADRFEALGAPEPDGVIHGDLHEGQLIVGPDGIVGVLDVDDAGPGSSADDIGNLLARLHYREIAATTVDTDALVRYRGELERATADRWPREMLHDHVSAALVGLATGPFRIQSAGWPELCGRLVERADELRRG